jgi:hypothetical protein
LRWQASCVSSSSAASTTAAVTPGAVTMGWSHTKPNRYAHVLAAFTPASTGVPACATNADCSDGDPCTDDVCSTGVCSHAPICGPAPVGIDTSSIKSVCDGTPADSLVIPSVTVGTWLDRVLVVTVGAEEDDADCNLASSQASVKYGALALTRAAAAVSGSSSWRACNGIFYLLNPPAGTANVTINFPPNGTNLIDNRHAGAFVLYNVAQQAPDATMTAGANATTNPVNTSITTLSPETLVVDVITQGNVGTFTAAQPGQTARWQASCVSSASATSTAEVAVPGSRTMGWSRTKPNRYAHALAAFRAAH